ncbi:MAG: aldehyde dehydrogenase family protein [Woeseiaceae bacterium]|nr:aldehyde dehydrogenase family protein [Woeseiaceae bacterium]
MVVDAVADEFAEKLAAKVKSMATGDPREGKTPLGAVVDAATVDKVNALIDDAASKGAKVLAGGKADSDPDAGNLDRWRYGRYEDLSRRKFRPGRRDDPCERRGGCHSHSQR